MGLHFQDSLTTAWRSCRAALGLGPTDWVSLAIEQVADIEWSRSLDGDAAERERFAHRIHCAVLAARQADGTGDIPAVLVALGDPGPEPPV